MVLLQYNFSIKKLASRTQQRYDLAESSIWNRMELLSPKSYPRRNIYRNK